MKKIIIGTVFTAAAAFIFMVSFSMVSGINNSYALQGGRMTAGGKSGNKSGKMTAKKNSKTKNDENKSKKDLNKMGAGCL